jgi:hypothetical protein
MVKMKTLKFIMYLFYRYYNKEGTKRIPYFSALCAVVFLIYIHIFQALIILGKVSLLPMQKDDLRIEKYIKLALFLLPIFLIVAYLVKPSDLKTLRYEEGKLKRGSTSLIIYVITNFILLFVLMFAFSKV